MIIVFVIDISSKWIVQNNYQNWASQNPMYSSASGIPLINGFLYVYLVYNKGAAWSFMANWGIGGRIVLLLISLIMSFALIFIYIKKNKSLNKLYKSGLALMIPGALGNLIDRAIYFGQNGGPDGVIDWISFHFGSYVFPTFNIADASLVCGAIVLLIGLIIDLVKESIEKSKNGEYTISPKERAALQNKQNESASDKTKLDTEINDKDTTKNG